jgi:multicomponent Na+:H+ antiporter subunit E
MLTRLAGLFCWAFLVWTLLTWTFTAEQEIFGTIVAVTVAVALAPLGDVAGPWLLLRPRALAGGVALVAATAWRSLLANLRLTRRIWDPRRPLSSGMVITPTRERTDGDLAAVGVISSLIVDNQIVDVDCDAHEFQYHAVAVPSGGPEQVRAQVNGPVEDLLAPFHRRRRVTR